MQLTVQKFTVDNKNKSATLQIHIDTKICPVMDYFEIFLTKNDNV